MPGLLVSRSEQIADQLAKNSIIIISEKVQLLVPQAILQIFLMVAVG